MSQFQVGQSGNPTGRPKGIKDRRALFNEMIDAHKESLLNKAIEMALNSNEQMLKLLLDRLLPAKPKDNVVSEINCLNGSLTEQGKTIVTLVSSAEITPSEGNHLMSIISSQAKLIEIDELEKRVTALEETMP